MTKFLIIQTAFIGDVILATPIIEKLYKHFPEAKIDFLLRQGNEGLLKGNPYLNNIIVWDKKYNKYSNLWSIIKRVRANKYDFVINLQRFLSTGLLTVLSGAKEKIGYDKNPLSFMFSHKVKHEIPSLHRKKVLINEANGEVKHEVQRNLDLITNYTDGELIKPKLYPNQSDYQAVQQYKMENYICIAPSSVWFTKQFPKENWIDFLDTVKMRTYLLGSHEDAEQCEDIIRLSTHINTQNLAGKLSFLQTAALMKDAEMNYVNDSAPLHIASAMNAPTTAIFCSTIPEFGFGPLADNSKIVQTKLELDCRPCGLHGFKKCPKGHFKCAKSIKLNN